MKVFFECRGVAPHLNLNEVKVFFECHRGWVGPHLNLNEVADLIFHLDIEGSLINLNTSAP